MSAQANDATVQASAMNDVLAGGEMGEGERSVAGAPLELVLLCRDRRQTASFCSSFVLRAGLKSQTINIISMLWGKKVRSGVADAGGVDRGDSDI
jgi:hypothetical protein